MRHNIIAIFVFIGFIATVFTLGYVTSRDTMPMYIGHTPEINTSGSRSVDRFSGADNNLAVQQHSTTIGRSAGNGYVGNSGSTPATMSNGGYSAGGLTTTSSQMLHSTGGGGSVGGVGGGSSRGNSVTASPSGGSLSTIPSLALNRNRREQTNELQQSEFQSLALYDVGNPRLGDWGGDDPEPGDQPGPYENPVGDVPIVLFMIMIGAYIAHKTFRLKHN